MAIGNGRRRLDDAGLERAGGGDDLHRRAGRLKGRERDAGQREQRAGLRVHRGDAAVAAAQRRDRGALERRVDRGRHVVPGLGVVVGEGAMAGEQRPSRRSGQRRLERALESVEAYLGVGRIALGGVDGGLVGRDRTEHAGDLDRDVGDRRGAVRALGERGAVGGVQGGARGERHVTVQSFASLEAREQQGRHVVHGDAVAVGGQGDLHGLAERPEQARRHHHPDRDLLVALGFHAGGGDRAHGGEGRVAAVRCGEPRLAEVAL